MASSRRFLNPSIVFDNGAFCVGYGEWLDSETESSMRLAARWHDPVNERQWIELPHEITVSLLAALSSVDGAQHGALFDALRECTDSGVTVGA